MKIPDTPENRALLKRFGVEYAPELPAWVVDALTSGLLRAPVHQSRRTLVTPEQAALLASRSGRVPFKRNPNASKETFRKAIDDSLKGVYDHKEAPGCRKMICAVCGAEFYDPNPAREARRRSILCPNCGKSYYEEAEPSDRGGDL